MGLVPPRVPMLSRIICSGVLESDDDYIETTGPNIIKSTTCRGCGAYFNQTIMRSCRYCGGFDTV